MTNFVHILQQLIFRLELLNPRIMKFKRIYIFIFLAFLITSCSSSFITASGGYSDIALNINSDEFEIIRLKPVSSVSTQIFGIPIDGNIGNRTATVDRFYSFNEIGTKKWMPIATLAALELPALTVILSRESRYYIRYYNDYTLFFTGLISIPLAAAINNAMWSPISRAKQRLNRKLIEENPDIDVFLNPKYTIENSMGLFMSNSRVTLSAMGATIKKTNKE